VSLNKTPEHSGDAEFAKSQDGDAAEGIGGSFPIVGIGMSAGGLEVATAFLNAMPPG
jgi:chemotaxis response regulator CheB